MLNTLILAVVFLCGGILMLPQLANKPLWKATITPLASIIGSGFLVLGPILDVSYGAYAPLVMAVLCFGAYVFGSAIRFNIKRIAAGPQRSKTVEHTETLASAVLAFAYIVSVAYYLNLFGAFGVSLTALNDSYHARVLTTGIYAIILIVGWTRGFAALERMEQLSVGIKLAIIGGLLFALAWYFAQKTVTGALVLNPANMTGWTAVTLAFGLIVTVQGFETSRYLGSAYDAATRVRSMRLAQGISTVIYMVYIMLLAFVFEPGTLALDETAIIDMMAIVAPILPTLLVAAALSAQFSAAVADTSGSGGLIHEVSGGRISHRTAYGVLVAVGVLLTWTSNVFEVISYASRAFAAYYALQAAIAALSAWNAQARNRAFIYGALAVLGIMITVFGRSVE